MSPEESNVSSVSAQPPITAEENELTAHGREKVAGGIPAIYQTMRFGLTRMGAGEDAEDAFAAQPEKRVRLPVVRVA